MLRTKLLDMSLRIVPAAWRLIPCAAPRTQNLTSGGSILRVALFALTLVCFLAVPTTYADTNTWSFADVDLCCNGSQAYYVSGIIQFYLNDQTVTSFSATTNPQDPTFPGVDFLSTRDQVLLSSPFAYDIKRQDGIEFDLAFGDNGLGSNVVFLPVSGRVFQTNGTASETIDDHFHFLGMITTPEPTTALLLFIALIASGPVLVLLEWKRR